AAVGEGGEVADARPRTDWAPVGIDGPVLVGDAGPGDGGRPGAGKGRQEVGRRCKRASSRPQGATPEPALHLYLQTEYHGVPAQRRQYPKMALSEGSLPLLAGGYQSLAGGEALCPGGLLGTKACGGAGFGYDAGNREGWGAEVQP